MPETSVKKIKVYHFQNGQSGGVLSVLKNLAEFSEASLIEHHIIFTINKEKTARFQIPSLTNITSSAIFYYSPKWNFFYTCKKLSQLLPDEKAVIVANDWLELGMVSHIALNNPVIQILHGDYEYYYNLAFKHRLAIDSYITVARAMTEKLSTKIPDRSKDIRYLPFPVPDTTAKVYSRNREALQIIFVGRLTKDKGYDLLPRIENNLRSKGVQVKWHIVGEMNKDAKSVWKPDSTIHFYGHLSNEKVLEIMHEVDCLVLPSLAEGMPVTVVEAMKVGLTCLVNDIPGGIQELIINGHTGYKVENNEVALYAELLMKLNADRALLEEIGVRARSKATEDFDPFINTARYEELIEKCYDLKREARKVTAIYGSRLDKGWIPNFITKTIRSFQ